MIITSSTASRFWSKVRITPNECWAWKGRVDKDGYGRFSLTHNRSVGAHRLSWEIANGEIPPGLFVCHECDTPGCVNPDHLFLGTVLDNSKDMVSKGRQATGLRNGKYTKPESTLRGDRHPFRLRPELAMRGDDNPARKHPERMPRGENNGNSVLTEPIVRQIKSLFLTGAYYNRDLARRFNISTGAVQHIIKGRHWKHVTVGI